MGSFPSSTADHPDALLPILYNRVYDCFPSPFPAELPSSSCLGLFGCLFNIAHFFPAPLNFSLPTACPSLLACISSLSPAGMDVIRGGMWPTGLCRTWACNSGEPLMLNAKQEKTISHHLAAQGGKSWVFVGCSVCLDVQTA